MSEPSPNWLADRCLAQIGDLRAAQPRSLLGDSSSSPPGFGLQNRANQLSVVDATKAAFPSLALLLAFYDTVSPACAAVFFAFFGFSTLICSGRVISTTDYCLWRLYFFPLLILLTVGVGRVPAEPVPLVGTYLGNERRALVPAPAPGKLRKLWKFWLGEGVSPVDGRPGRTWRGAGWTGQPVLVEEDGEVFVVQPAFDYSLRKIRLRDGKLVWRAVLGDILKASPLFLVNPEARSEEERYLIIQGSRMGHENSLTSPVCPALHAVSWRTGRVLWLLNVARTALNSRDVDATPAVCNGLLYAPLENGRVAAVHPAPSRAKLEDGLMQPQVVREFPLYDAGEVRRFGSDLAPEASPTLLKGILYFPGGSGKLTAVRAGGKKAMWSLDLGGDCDGSAVATGDGGLLVSVEKQFVPGPGGVFKVRPGRKGDAAVEWFFPAEDVDFFQWRGGVVGSATCNDAVNSAGDPALAAWVGVDGWLTVVRHREIDASAAQEAGPWLRGKFSRPQVVHRERVGGTISTVIWSANRRLVLPLDKGLVLMEYDAAGNFRTLDRVRGPGFDATPVIWGGRVIAGSRDGWLYCWGEDSE